jgi:hypothetical protein
MFKRPQPPPKKTVAIAIPTHKTSLSPDEMISLAHLKKFLAPHDRFLVVPRGSKPDFASGMTIEEFPEACFSSVSAYNQDLRLSKDYYARFKQYEYLLTYELDALVFSDQLLEWCQKKYDYIGAPWFRDFDLAGPLAPLLGVGNSGFCLQNIARTIKILELYQSWPARAQRYILRKSRNLSARLLASSQYHKPADPDHIQWHAGDNNDLFFGFEARNWWPDFRIAPLEEALNFSFEVQPRRCLEINHGRLPFGCHAWARYDRAFWEPHLLKTI